LIFNERRREHDLNGKKKRENRESGEGKETENPVGLLLQCPPDFCLLENNKVRPEIPTSGIF
jgi:hypothetical protein